METQTPAQGELTERAPVAGPVAGSVTPEAPAVPEQPLSIAEHAAQYGPEAQDREEADEPDLKPIRPVDQQRRDQGKFAEGRRPIKSKDAVTRINELTGRAKTAEEKLATAEAELTRLRAQQAPPAQVARAEQRVERAEAQAPPRNGDAQRAQRQEPQDPEPTEADAKYGGDYGKYLVDHARWAARDEHRKWEVQHNERRALEAAQVSVAERMKAAKAKYADFDVVAERVMARIPLKSVVESWIFEHDFGDDVLYSFDSHPEELDAILRMPRAIQQLDALTLHAQRFASPPPAQAGSTGSAAGPRQIVIPPRPPNPVRTEAHAAGDAPPDGPSASIAEHRTRFHPKPR